MESQKQTGSYEAVRSKMSIPMVPVPPKDTLKSKFKGIALLRENFLTQSLVSQTTSIEEAQTLTEEKEKQFRKSIIRNNVRAFFRQVERHPFFIEHPEIGKEFKRLKKRRMNKLGRRLNSHIVSPVVIYGLVQACLDYELAPDQTAAYKLIYKWLNGVVTIEKIRADYRKATTDDRYKSLFIEYPETREILSEEEYLKRMSEAVTPIPGETITMQATSAYGDSIEVIVTAE